MGKKCERNCSFAVQRCDPLDENNDFTPGVESQFVPVCEKKKKKKKKKKKEPSGIGSSSRRLTLISAVLPSEPECTSSHSLHSRDIACSAPPDPIPQAVGGSPSPGGHEPNHESICRPITGRRHPEHLVGSQAGSAGNQ